MLQSWRTGGISVEDHICVHIPARFASVGQCVAREGWAHPERVLDSTVLIVVESGRFGLAVEDQEYVLEAHQALLLPAGRRHSGFHCKDETAPRYYWAHFEDGQGMGSQALKLGLPPLHLTDIAFNRIANGFHQLLNENSLSPGEGLLSDYMLSLILLELQREGRQTQRSAVTNRMFEYIRLHCYEKLTLLELSRALGYSEDYLSRLFHENASCSFRSYIHHLRLMRAKRELLSSVKTIQQIAEECGYSNAKFFSTAFMKQEGVTPSAYRNLYGGLHQNNA